MASKPNCESTSLLLDIVEESVAGDELHTTDTTSDVLTDTVATAQTDSKKKKKWTDDENAALDAGIEEHGFGKWKDIKNNPLYSGILSDRSVVDIKDKYRNVHNAEELAIYRAAWNNAKKEKEEIRRQAFVTSVAEAAVSIEDSYPNLFEVKKVNESLMDSSITVRGIIASTTHVNRDIGSVVLKEGDFTIKCVLNTADNLIRLQDVKDVTHLAANSYLAFEGLVSLPSARIKRSMKNVSQKVVLQVTRIHGIGKTVPRAPVDTDRAAQNETVLEKDMEVRESSRVFSNVPPPVNQGILRIQSPIEQVVEPSKVSDVLAVANPGILRIQSSIEYILRDFLLSANFVGMHTQKLISDSSGATSVCKLNCQGYPTFLALSPQFARQMAIIGGSHRVFEIGPVFKVDSISKQLCEYTGLDVEMRIHEDYGEVMGFVEHLCLTMFDRLYEECMEDIEAIQKQYSCEKLKYSECVKLSFKVATQMLEDAGTKVNHPLGRLNSEEERKLGDLVLEGHGTEFYILYNCPFAGSTFYTKQSPDARYSYSFDVFIRGKKIICGGERESDPSALYSTAAHLKSTGTDLGDSDSVAKYIEAFQCTVPQHVGFGVDLDQVLRILFAIDNTDKAGVDGKEEALKGIQAGGVQDDKVASRKARKGARVRDKGKQ